MGDVVALDKRKREQATPKDPDGRPTPSDPIVEAALLFMLMQPGMASPELSATLRLLLPDHFFVPQNARIFEAVRELSIDGATVDAVGVQARLKDVPAPMGGWWTYLTETIPLHGVHAEARPSDYAKILLDKWRAREVLKVCSRVMNNGFDGVHSHVLIEDARVSLACIADTQIESVATTAHDALADAWAELIAKGQRVKGLSWGWPSADAAFGRMLPGRVTYLAAVPGIGKTNIAWHVSEAVALSAEDEHGVGDAVYFVSGELRAHELVSRQAGIRANVPPEALEGDRELTADEMKRLEEAQLDIASMPIVVDDNGGRQFAISQIEARVRAAQLRFAAGTYARRDGARYPRNRLRLVVVDYVTKMKPPPKPHGQKYDSREQEVGAISGALVELAKVLDVHILAIAAVSRGGKEKGADVKKRELHMSDLRESGQLEYDAASIIFANAPQDGVIRLRTDKQRFRKGGGPVDLEMERGRIFESRAG